MLFSYHTLLLLYICIGICTNLAKYRGKSCIKWISLCPLGLNLIGIWFWLDYRAVNRFKTISFDETMMFLGNCPGITSRKWEYSKGNIPIFRKSSHTMFSSYSRPGFWYLTLIGISAQSGGNSWPTANPLNAPPQLSIPYVVPKELWTLNEVKAALIRKFPHLSTEEGQGCQR